MKPDISADMPYFLGYLKKRMDFIAQVATSAPSWCMVTSFDDLIDRFKLRFEVTVSDDWEAEHRGWLEDYYRVMITERIKTETSPAAKTGVVAALNKFLAEELTNPVTGIVNPRNWGMKEIKICAAYLRMV